MFWPVRNRGTFWCAAMLSVLLLAPYVYADMTAALQAYRSGDFATALKEFRTAAEAGDATAMFSLGFMFLRGEGVSPNPKEAIAWLSRASELGMAPAQHSLGVAYYEGRGVERNSAVAANYFESAALQGLADAQFNLAVLCARGDGVKQNWKLAEFWHRKAAEQGITDSMVALGVMHANGQGVNRDYPEAARWFGQAAAAGNKRAIRMLESALAEPIPASALDKPSELRNGESGSGADFGQKGEAAKLTVEQVQGNRKAESKATHPPEPEVVARATANRKKNFWRVAPAKLSEAAFQDLQARAVMGSIEGQVDLALQYYHGTSVKRSLIRAYVWARLAALKGDADGERMSSGIYRELDDQQKSVANQVILEWTKK